ncbi:MAG: DUF6273 domain-containing protein [Oscillospiraceae bacterium]|jgi:hypothetical protein|nr:DUF6273 domain-containing protein [Oscillospiraceae bacterium]
MPNHVTNIITIEGVSEDRLAAILAAVRMDEVEGRRSLDFNKIIPMPDAVFQGNLGNEERQIYGENNGTTDKWWLRTSGNTLSRAANIAYDGSVSPSGEQVFQLQGIRPAIWVDITPESESGN